MDLLLKKLKRKFTISTSVVAGLFLLFIFLGFFLLLFGSTEVAAEQTMQKVLDTFTYDSTQTNGNRVILLSVKDGTPQIVNGDIKYYGDASIQAQIRDTAIEKENGRFTVSRFNFRVASKQTKDGEMRYVIYDRSTDIDHLIITALIQVFVYLVSCVFSLLISSIFSKKALSPVEEAFKRQRDLVANASHELKTPITIISTNLSVIKSEPSSTVQENEKWIESIDDQLIRMNGLVTNMLNLSKMEHDVPKLEYLNFSQIVEGAALNFEAVCFEKDVRLLVDVTPNIHVMGDFGPLERVVTILIDNAIKYCGDEGKVACKLTTENKKAKLIVLNTGQSITEDEAKHVFDRFYRADGARKNPDNQSFGLGLAIAYATVTSHKGKITCRGVENRGTIFEVLLPLAKDPNLKRHLTIKTKNKKKD